MTEAEILYYAWVGRLFIYTLAFVIVGGLVAGIVYSLYKEIEAKFRKPVRRERKREPEFFFGEARIDDEGRVVGVIRAESDRREAVRGICEEKRS